MKETLKSYLESECNRMYDQTDMQLEKNMKQLLTGLENWRRKEEEKKYKRCWAEIKVPFTLDEALRKYTKHELDTIRKTLQIKNASSLEKDELIAFLNEKIPGFIVKIVYNLDVLLINLLFNIQKSGINFIV